MYWWWLLPSFQSPWTRAAPPPGAHKHGLYIVDKLTSQAFKMQKNSHEFIHCTYNRTLWEAFVKSWLWASCLTPMQSSNTPYATYLQRQHGRRPQSCHHLVHNLQRRISGRRRLEQGSHWCCESGWGALDHTERRRKQTWTSTIRQPSCTTMLSERKFLEQHLEQHFGLSESWIQGRGMDQISHQPVLPALGAWKQHFHLRRSGGAEALQQSQVMPYTRRTIREETED